MTDPTTTPTPTEAQEPGDAPDRCGTCEAICDDDLGCECGVECTRPARGGIDPEPAPSPAVSAAAPTNEQQDVREPEWLVRVNDEARTTLDNLPAASRPAWYRARVNGDDAWWESLVQAECDAGHVIFVDDGDGTVYACPACALAEARAALAARPAADVECDHAKAAREIARTTPLSLDAATALIDSLARGALTLADAWDEGWRACAGAAGSASPHHNGPANPYRTVADAPAAEPEQAPERLCADCGHVEGVHACTFAAIRCAMCGCTAFRPAADDECCGWCGAKPTHAPEDCPRARDYQSQQIADAQTAADDEGGQA